MVNKKHLHHTWRHLRPISHWYFLLAFLIFSGIAAYALRQNNLTALELRETVAAADKENKNVEKPLRELREFIYGHMNADLSAGTGIQHPVQLKYRYERLVKAERARVEKANSSVYRDAQRRCGQGSLIGTGRLQCITNYVNKYGAKEQEIQEDLYKFDFASPNWSPDLAGWSVLLAALSLGLFIIRFILERWIKFELN